MRVAHGLNKGVFNRGCFLIYAALLITASCGGLQPTVITEHQPSVEVQKQAINPNHSPIAVFPLQNGTGQPGFDWLSIALQESITDDLLNISELNTRTLPDLNQLVSKQCPDMRLSCVAGSNAGEDAGKGLTYPGQTGRKLPPLPGLDNSSGGATGRTGSRLKFSYRSIPDRNGHSLAEMKRQAAMGGLLQETSAQVVTFLQSRGLPVKPCRKRAHPGPRDTIGRRMGKQCHGVLDAAVIPGSR